MYAQKVAKPPTKTTVSSTAKESGRQREPGAILSARKAPDLLWDFSKLPISAPDRTNRAQARSPFITPRSAVRPVEDALEPEADSVAEQMMRNKPAAKPVEAPISPARAGSLTLHRFPSTGPERVASDPARGLEPRGRRDARGASIFGQDLATMSVYGNRLSGPLRSAHRGRAVAGETMRAGEVEDGEGPRQLAGDGEATGAHVFANPPPKPDAAARTLTPKEMADALDYNGKVLKDANEISILRNAVGAPAGDTVDEDFVLAIVQFQAVSDIHQDGKLGPTTSGRLSRELRAEARPLSRDEARPLRQAARQRDRYSFDISVVAAAAELTNTGSAEYRVRWSVPDPTANGWIVQHVRFTGTKFDAVGAPVATNTTGAEYWEGWQVRAGRSLRRG